MSNEEYIPDRGDLVWLNFNSQSGHKQAGKRPALVISPLIYNKKVGLALFCPVTNKVKGYPFEVNLPSTSKVTGVLLSDRIKSFDWRAGKATFVCKVRKEILSECLKKLNALLQIKD
jgi:mRNA interferase MazF